MSCNKHNLSSIKHCHQWGLALVVMFIISSVFVSSCANNQMLEGSNTGGDVAAGSGVTVVSGEIQLLLAAGPIQSSTLYNVDTNSIDSLIQPTEHLMKQKVLQQIF